jgi:hypothetical protein
MFVIHGRRIIRVRKYSDNQHFCKSCGSNNLIVRIYRQYFHVFFIPFFPTGIKSSHIHCGACGEPLRNEAIQNQYESNAGRPFYLYAGPLLVGGLILWLVIANILTQKEKAKFVDDPKVGDVYQIRKSENNTTYYYFLRVTQITGDTVIVCRNSMLYTRYISRLINEDFFVREDTLSVTKSGLKKMLDNGDINAVERNYDDSEGFNRMQ